jgi:hypothetical protein
MVTHKDRVAIYNNLEQEIFRLADQHGDIVLISGMAEGWDEAITKIGMRNEIPYICCLPNKGYGDYYWRRNSLLGVNRIETFNELCEKANDVVFVCDTLYVDGVHANFIRNQFMVDLCTHALVYDKSSAGTRDAVKRLEAAGKPFKAYPFS